MLVPLFFMILRNSLKGGITCLFILLIRAIFRRKLPKAFLMCLWTVMFIRLVLPFEIPSPTSIYNLFSNQTAVPYSTVTSSNVEAIDRDSSLSPTSPVYTSRPDTAGIHNSNKQFLIADGIFNMAERSPFVNMASTIWISIAALHFLILSILYFATRLSLRGMKPLKCPAEIDWVKQQGLSKRVSIYTSNRVKSPGVLGLIHAKIVFPTSFNFSDSRNFHYILSHELQHVKGYDNLKSQLVLLVLCIQWFNPIVWIAKILLMRDMEEACDQRVLKGLSIDGRKEYAMTLLAMAKHERNQLAFISGFGESAVKARIKSIMAFKKVTMAGTVVAVVVVASVIMAFATGRLGEHMSQNNTLSNSSSSTPGMFIASSSSSSSDTTDTGSTSASKTDSSAGKESSPSSKPDFETAAYSNQDISERVIDYILNGQGDIPSADKLNWSQTFLNQVQIGNVYKQYTANGGNSNDIKSFATYLTQNAPILKNWKELFESDLFKQYKVSVSRYELMLGYPNSYQVYVKQGNTDVPYVVVNARTGYFHG